MPLLIDSHCHLHLPRYDADRDAVLARMRRDDVWAVTIGTSVGLSEQAVAFAEKTDGVWATVAYHPEHLTSGYHDADEGEAGEYSLADLERVARSSRKVVAIGETGLDFFRFDEDRDVDEAKALQTSVFRDHIGLARELDLPLVIHCRNAMPEIIDVLRDESRKGGVRGVMHFFTGTWDEAQALLDLGFHLGFTGAITFPIKKTQDPATHIHRVIERMPLDKLLIETDAPWLAPQSHRGERNEPAYVKDVAEKIADLRGISFDDIATQTTENAIRVFRLT
ncbi:MAG: TatD family hydrolase [Patescibacteria group bacterium]